MRFLESLAARAAGRAQVLQPRPRSLFERGAEMEVMEGVREEEPLQSKRVISQPPIAAQPIAIRAGNPEREPNSPKVARQAFIERETKTVIRNNAIEPAKTEHHFSTSTTVVTEQARKEPAPLLPVREMVRKETVHSMPIVRQVHSPAPTFPTARPIEKVTPPGLTAAPPAIHVTIGRIEVRAVAAVQPSPRAAQSPRSAPKPSLEEWLGKNG